MGTEKKFIETYLLSTFGVVAVLVLAIAVNFIASAVNKRADFTEENLYTLSEGTRAILGDLDTPVTLRFYFSKDAAQLPVHLKSYAQRVEDILKEYRVAGRGNIVVEKLNPKPDSDAEDSANLDGVHGQPIGMTGDRVYLGVAINCLDETVALPFLSPDRENLLEYDITRAVYRVMNSEKAVLGIMSALSVMGKQAPQNPMMMQMQQQQQNKPPWVVTSELKRDFDVREVPKDTEEIDGDIDILMLVHASELSDKTLFAIDQFVLRGGKLLAFVDPMSVIERQEKPPMPQMQYMPPGASTLGALFDAWGIEFDTEKVAGDLIYMTRIQREGRQESMPTVLSLTSKALNADDPVTSQLENLLIVNGGAFSGDGVDGLTKTVLISTSEDSQLIEKFKAQMPGDHIVKDFKPEERRQELAIRLTGTFKTAFPEGKPEDDADKDDEDDKKGEDEAEAAPSHLTESAGEGAVILVGDSDMVHDHFCVRRQQFFGQQIVQPMNDNLSFVQNLAELLSGDNNLISIRSRGTLSRPFEVVLRMKAEAEQRYQEKISALEDELSEVQRKINDLQRKKSDDQKFIVSKEQREQISKFRKKEAESRKKLKDVRKKFRRDIDSLENNLKWANIGLMPFLVGLSGIALAIVKRRRMIRK
ncbi:MAG: hypothetical protein HN742_38025 [Lentisphaerae bacterium]|jgi:ABC-type uncharacterized transport system involved in gliding motility auxiliary subunit|nr:hypothetical protein [Lentisphaerota bacterium]MBT4817124.1 hypothetical protein [Lentisphaerota bacterium]MBT5608095.1 hypothetical protein [Lentisphaerota bacterium]MBT7060628.1 hypothetical protein [Lentisphaerota bacterium]MBT7847727.1 hypothetical protein [Lentisphaerota bacterium]